MQTVLGVCVRLTPPHLPPRVMATVHAGRGLPLTLTLTLTVTLVLALTHHQPFREASALATPSPGVDDGHSAQWRT